jgi:hypothetical protein
MKQRSIRIALLVSIASVLGACSDGDTDNALSNWDGLEREITHEKLLPDIEIMTVGSIIPTGDNIIVQGASQDGEFSVFHAKGDSILYGGSFLHYGRAEYEVLAAKAHYVSENNTLIIAGYNPVGRYIAIPLERLDNVFDRSS